MSDKKIFQERINLELDLLLDDFEGQWDLITFEKEKFIPIEYGYGKFSNLIMEPHNFLEISFETKNDSHCMMTSLSRDEFNTKFDQINDSYINSLKNNRLSNCYISLGIIEYENFLGPCILIPIFLENNQNNYRIFRNYNQEIQFNGLFRFILDEDDIEIPEFEEDIENFIGLLSDVDDINYYKESYIGTFDLKFQHLFYDLNVERWDSISEKWNLFTHNNGILIDCDLNLFKDKLEGYAKDIEINNDILFLKSLLSKNNSILVIADNLTQDKIKNSFRSDDLENFILELSEDLSENELYENIIGSEKIQGADVVELDNLVRNHEESSEILELINNNYSKFNISPKEIKTRKDNYYAQIIDLNIDDFIFDFENITDYNKRMCEGIEKQIRDISLTESEVNNLRAHVSSDYLKSNDFKNLVKLSDSVERHLNYFSHLNEELNEDYGLKLFEDIYSVNQVADISILNKNPVFIEGRDIVPLNEYIKNYSKSEKCIENDNLNKYFRADDNLIDSVDINLKYTELINNEILSEDSVDLILDDFGQAINSFNFLSDISYFILREIHEIIEFYNTFEVFDIDSDLLTIEGSIESIKQLITTFRHNIESLEIFKKDYESFSGLNEEFKNFIKFINDNEIEKDEISVIFWFNIYNSLLNSFLLKHDYIEEDKISCEYESEYKEVDERLVYDNEQLLTQHIYSKSLELNRDEKAINQKQDLINNYKAGNLDSIKNILTDYKEYIVANNRIFLMDMDLIPQFLDESYENHFDYVIVTQNLRYDLDKLSLLLRSKNKIIQIKV